MATQKFPKKKMKPADDKTRRQPKKKGRKAPAKQEC